MIVKSKIEGLNEWLFIEELPEIYQASSPLSEKKVAIQRFPVQMANYQLTTGGMFLMHSEMNFERSSRIHTEVIGETIASQFIFYTNSDKKVQGRGYSNSRHNIRYIPSTVEDYEVAAGTQYTYFLMVLSKAYYFQLIDKNSRLHEEFVHDIEKGTYTSFSTQDFAVTTEMRRVIHDLVECRQQGELKKLHTESRILELLMYQMEQMGDRDTSHKMVLRDIDVNKVEHARTILNDRFTNPPTLKELSREISLNEFKLKRAFKEYVGTTVYDYITRLRMERAKALLMEGENNVYEIASLIGFKHPPGFSSAFKKYYGIPPSKVVIR